jgi:lipopolysaccharide transport system ATP-binding protein
MSSEIILEVKNITKNYKLYDKNLNRVLEYITLNKKRFHSEFKAIDKISFKIKRGETIGIIGRNGSGKSTLLQIISQIITPSEGEVIIRGRVAALLELGSGFNPEFTGRENVYLNGSLLGLSTREINKNLQKIIEFADIGEFIDQEVKKYSSGMMLRLAFSVIANVNADILIIDEALAVGDALFTLKCMQYLRDFKKTGTIIFVSHDINAVLNLCDKAIYLQKGKIEAIGNTKEVIEAYQLSMQETMAKGKAQLIKINDEQNLKETQLNSKAEQLDQKRSKTLFKSNLEKATGWKSGFGEIKSIKLHSLENKKLEVYSGGEYVKLEIIAKSNTKIIKPIIGFIVRDRLGQDLFGENTLVIKEKISSIEKNDKIKAEFNFRLPFLQNGQYVIMASFAEGDIVENIQHHWLNNAAIITVSSSNVRWGLVGIAFDSVKLKVEK